VNTFHKKTEQMLEKVDFKWFDEVSLKGLYQDVKNVIVSKVVNDK
jgi:hypothetical protein